MSSSCSANTTNATNFIEVRTQHTPMPQRTVYQQLGALLVFPMKLDCRRASSLPVSYGLKKVMPLPSCMFLVYISFLFSPSLVSTHTQRSLRSLPQIVAACHCVAVMRAAALSQLTETTSLRFLGGDCAELLRLVDLIPIGSRRAASDRAQAQAVERAPAPAADLASPPVASMSTSAVTTEAGHVAERGPSRCARPCRPTSQDRALRRPPCNPPLPTKNVCMYSMG